jgi:hypothetical protein
MSASIGYDLEFPRVAPEAPREAVLHERYADGTRRQIATGRGDDESTAIYDLLLRALAAGASETAITVVHQLYALRLQQQPPQD